MENSNTDNTNNDGITMVVKKVPLDILVDLLIELYNKGVDYVDIHGVQNDKLVVSFDKDYVNEKYINDISSPSNKETEIQSHKLTDEDLNELL